MTGQHQLLAQANLRHRADSRDFFAVLFTTRRLEIPLADEETENKEVQNEIYNDNRNQRHPVGLCLTWQNAVQNKVNQAVRECSTDADLQDVADREGCASQYNVYSKQCRSKEQESKLDRLGNAGQNRRKQPNF